MSRRTRSGAVAGVAAVLSSVLVSLAVPGPARAAGETPPDAPPPVALRIATYNIHAAAGADNVYDLDRTAAEIRATGADVVGLQEVDVHWGDRSVFEDTAQALADRLGMRVFFAPIYSLDPLSDGAPRREYGVALLSRFPVVAAENHDLTRLSTQTPDPVPAPAPGFAEAVVEARGARVHVYVTHLDYRGDPSVRRLQVADTLRILDDDPDGASQVLVGDLNAGEGAPELAPLWDRLDDAWVETHGLGAGGATYPAGKPRSRIDRIAVSHDVTVTRVVVPGDSLARTASDHRPVVADLLVPRGADGTPGTSEPSKES